MQTSYDQPAALAPEKELFGGKVSTQNGHLFPMLLDCLLLEAETTGTEEAHLGICSIAVTSKEHSAWSISP
jgi:hypothetical protein